MNTSKFATAIIGVALLAGIARGASDAIPNATAADQAPAIDRPLQPAVARETPDDQPSPEYEWIAGHWRWQEGAFIWVTAHWELPPVQGADWVPPHWETRGAGSGYTLIEGFWQVGGDPGNPGNAAPPREVVTVVVPPPPPMREMIYERPSAMDVWIPGYWGWQGDRHVWVAGRWDRPPHEHMVWVPARWEQRGNGFALIQGFWREVGVSFGVSIGIGGPPPNVRPPPREVVVIRDPPPPPRHEVQPPRPSPLHVWIGGYWVFQGGRQAWIAGHWERPPPGRRTWTPARWEHRSNGYVFIEGSWR